MAVMYGHDVLPKNDYFVTLAVTAIHQLSMGFAASAFLLNMFPVLRYMPTWFPGAAFKRIALEGRAMAWAMRDVPIGNVRKQMVVILKPLASNYNGFQLIIDSSLAIQREGKAPNCVTADLLDTCTSEEDYIEISNVSATAYSGK